MKRPFQLTVSLFIFLTSLGLALTAPAAPNQKPAGPDESKAVNVSLQPSAGSVEFLATGRPSMLKIHGKGPGPTGHLSVNGRDLSGKIEFELKELNTGIETRDKHMKEKYLEVEKYPVTTLDIQSMKLPITMSELATAAPSTFEIPFTGELELHGAKHPVSGKIKLENQKGKPLQVEASFPIKITDYKIEIPSYAGIKIAEDVVVTVNTKVTK
jgi:polyisoprenoid-binding protein YceI